MHFFLFVSFSSFCLYLSTALAAAEEVVLITHGDCGPSGVDGGAAVAGWGVALYAGPEDAVDLSATPLVTLFGPVVFPEAVRRRRPPLAAFSLDAIVSNDNTSELSAVTEALLFVAELLGPLRRRAARRAAPSLPICGPRHPVQLLCLRRDRRSGPGRLAWCPRGAAAGGPRGGPRPNGGSWRRLVPVGVRAHEPCDDRGW